MDREAPIDGCTTTVAALAPQVGNVLYRRPIGQPLRETLPHQHGSFDFDHRYQGEDYRGSIPSKRRYFYGLRVHLVVTASGQPVEFFLLPGADNDTGALHWYQFDLPAGARIVGDKACTV